MERVGKKLFKDGVRALDAGLGLDSIDSDPARGM
jgi:hypothetical protein